MYIETKELSQALAPYFALQEEDAYETLKARLTEEIQYLIDYNLDKLWSLLYRIDVAEKKVKEVIETQPYGRHAACIADLIIERQQQKIVSRRNHKT